MKNPFGYVTNVFNALRGRGGGSVKSATVEQGRGFDAVQANRKRRSIALVKGIIAAADYHLNKTTLGSLRELCRMHDRRSSLFSGILDRAQDNIFGSDFDFIPNTGDKEANKIVKEYILERMEKENFDAAGVNDFVDGGKKCLRAIWNDGDDLFVKRSSGSVLAFESEQIETPKDRKDKNIVLGVELDELGRHVAYHINQRITKNDYGTVKAKENSERIPAYNAIMPAFRKRFGQTRGYPFLAAALGFFCRFNSYLDFESMAAEGNAMLGYQITREPGCETQPLATDKDNDDTDSTFSKLSQMEPFMIFDLLEGEKIGMISSERPGENFESYITMCCRVIGVAVGYPLELMLLNFSDTNFSAARASMGEARRSFKAWQKFMQKQFCMPWYRWQIARGIASGRLKIVKGADLFKAKCQWPAWEYIDPYKEARGNQISIETRTKSISQCIRDTGNDPDEVFDEIEEERKKLKERGITLPEDIKNTRTKIRESQND